MEEVVVGSSVLVTYLLTDDRPYQKSVSRFDGLDLPLRSSYDEILDRFKQASA